MQKQLSYYLLAIIFILNSCSNEEYNYSVNTILPKTLKTIYPDYPKDNFSTDFIYDGNKIVSIRNKNEKRNYEYEGNNIVKETVYSLYKGEETKYAETNYSYKNDSLKTVTTLLNGEKIRYDYSYNNNGSINKEVYNLDNNTGKESKKSEKDLITIINGNIANSESDWGDNYDVISTIKYEYDTNNNAFKILEV